MIKTGGRPLTSTEVYDGVLPVHSPGHHVQHREADGGEDGEPGLAHRAPDLGQGRVTHVHVWTVRQTVRLRMY